MTKIIAPSGTECDVSDDLAEALMRRGWTRPREPRRGATADLVVMDEAQRLADSDEPDEGAESDTSDDASDPDANAAEGEAERDGDADEAGGDGTEGIDFTAAVPKARRK